MKHLFMWRGTRAGEDVIVIADSLDEARATAVEQRQDVETHRSLSREPDVVAALAMLPKTEVFFLTRHVTASDITRRTLRL